MFPGKYILRICFLLSVVKRNDALSVEASPKTFHAYIDVRQRLIDVYLVARLVSCCAVPWSGQLKALVTIETHSLVKH